MRKLGLDVGDVRVGVALSDPSGTLASPLTVLERRDIEGEAKGLADLVREHDVDELVVGLPTTMRGEDGHMAEQMRSVADHLRKVLALPVHLLDERLTSVAAKRALTDAGSSGDAGPGAVDQAAAAIILQDFLDRRGSEDAATA